MVAQAHFGGSNTYKIEVVSEDFNSMNAEESIERVKNLIKHLNGEVTSIKTWTPQ